jgi:ATP-dependent Clp protease adapter protein ClpS
MLITMEAHQIGDMVVSACPDDRACTGVVSMEKQNSGDNTSCPGSMHT